MYRQTYQPMSMAGGIAGSAQPSSNVPATVQITERITRGFNPATGLVGDIVVSREFKVIGGGLTTRQVFLVPAQAPPPLAFFPRQVHARRSEGKASGCGGCIGEGRATEETAAWDAKVEEQQGCTKPHVPPQNSPWLQLRQLCLPHDLAFSPPVPSTGTLTPSTDRTLVNSLAQPAPAELNEAVPTPAPDPDAAADEFDKLWACLLANAAPAAVSPEDVPTPAGAMAGPAAGDALSDPTLYYPCFNFGCDARPG
ncbi:hypothetical protein B0T16DRAFT_389722 [Cercophora newfieldiana]|uniref:Uncharacterized protein n=1 Tax=Cercophora newfieldiana TaxID=92897 RepID=A0AA39YEV3_9PEZI|nr:hypothetical protein B0T16DRAFT_389722 [Cercophora newfieldiana]